MSKATKRYIVFILLAFCVAIPCILPAVSLRFTSEQGHKTYVPALHLSAVRPRFDAQVFPAVLDAYRQNGIQAAVLTEKNQTFDEEELLLAQKAGLDICLMLSDGEEKKTSYAADLERIIAAYNVKYILPEATGKKPDFPVPIETLLQNTDITLILKETADQLANEQFAGFEDCVASAEGRIMRCFETWENPAKNLVSESTTTDYGDLLYHQMCNSARDRNTEFILVNQITAGTADVMTKAAQTQKAVSDFSAFMERTGYAVHTRPDLSGYIPYRRLLSGGAAFLGTLMLLSILNIVFKKSEKTLDYAMLTAGFLLFGLSFLLPEKLLLLYPTAFALLAPCFILTSCAYIAEKQKERMGGFRHLCCMLSVAFILLLLCAAVQCALLSGADYYLNFLVFRGVKLALFVPVLFAVAAMFLFYTGGNIKHTFRHLPEKVKTLVSNLRPVHALLVLAVLLLFGIYIFRSGNRQITGLEYRIRNTLAELTTARPRTKEFLLGWPCFALWMRCVYKNNTTLFKCLFSVGASVLFASVINSFCHVFTDATISALRTVYGLLFAVPFIVSAVLLHRFFSKHSEK